MKITATGILSGKGVLSNSEIFFNSESEFAKSALYYVLHAGDFYCNQNYCIDRENFDSFLIMFIHSGKMKIRYKNKEFIATEKNIVFLNCYHSHSYRAEGDVHFEYFHFDGNSSEKYFNFLYNKIECVIPVGNSMLVPKYIGQIVRAAKTDSMDDHFYSMVIHKILYELVQATNTTGKVLDGQIHHVLSYIENHFQEDITLKELSETMNLSVYHFSRIFKRYIGSSPYQYILDFRIQHAKKLLLTTEDSVEAIAYESGFNSISHFVKTFKKRSNLTPKQFRKFNF